MLHTLVDEVLHFRFEAALGQSPNTTHFHTKSIYSKFGVRNRSALSALWLGKLR